jgi:hypothetical protein
MQLIQAATGFLVERRVNSSPRLLGTCFSFRHPHTLVTAAHCVAGLAPDDIGFVYPTTEEADEGLSLSSIARHPTADIAVVRLPDLGSLRILESFWNHSDTLEWGEEIAAFGFPSDSSLELGIVPTPRMFRGCIQRYFRHQSHMGYKYRAVELSIGAPAGLSGGPVCWTRDLSRVVGVVTENLETSTFLAQSEEVQEGGKVVRHETRNIISYALAVSLIDVTDWLWEVIDP